MQEPRGMLGMDHPWAQLVPPGCDVQPSASSLGGGLPMHQLRNQSQNQSNNENPQKNPKPTTPWKSQANNPRSNKDNPQKTQPKKPIKPPFPTNKQNNTQPPSSKTTRVLGGSTQDTTEEGREEVSLVFGECSGWKLGPWVGLPFYFFFIIIFFIFFLFYFI